MKTNHLFIYMTAYSLLVAGSLFLPYCEGDVYQVERLNFFNVDRHLISSNVQLFGSDLLTAYVPFGFILLLAPVVLVQRSVLTANIGRVLGVLLFLYVGTLGMLLVMSPSPIDDLYDAELGNGYYLLLLGTAAMTIVLALHAAVVKRWPNDDKQPNEELLDDTEESVPDF